MIFLSASLLKYGNTNSIITRDRIKAMIVRIIVSPRNCCISWLRSAPTTLRSPISRALFNDPAVVRLIKFIQAITRMKNPIREKIYTLFMSPTIAGLS